MSTVIWELYQNRAIIYMREFVPNYNDSIIRSFMQRLIERHDGLTQSRFLSLESKVPRLDPR